MRMFAGVTHDEVNEAYLQQKIEERGDVFVPRTLRDPPPDGEFVRVLIDWDSLDAGRREDFLAHVLAGHEQDHVALHSFTLDERDAEVLRRKGVAVFERLEPDALDWLLRAC